MIYNTRTFLRRFKRKKSATCHTSFLFSAKAEPPSAAGLPRRRRGDAARRDRWAAAPWLRVQVLARSASTIQHFAFDLPRTLGNASFNFPSTSSFVFYSELLLRESPSSSSGIPRGMCCRPSASGEAAKNSVLPARMLPGFFQNFKGIMMRAILQMHTASEQFY